MALRLGISMGDVTGIGPEVVLKALAAENQADDTQYQLIGDGQLTTELNHKLGLNLAFGESATARLRLIEPLPQPLPHDLGPGSPVAARAAVAWVRAGAELCLAGKLDGLITAPVNKEAILRAGAEFVGQTELLAELARARRTAMMLLGHDDRGRWLRVALVTTHVPLKAVAEQLTSRKVLQVIELAAKACRELGLPRARIGVCGLNPHAGEGGKMGEEEQTIIAPAVEAARTNQLDAIGPLSADALFYYALRGDYDAVVAMYHDQGLAPLKTVAFDHGVNWTVGLPFVRTSPDHGTAYDIAGQDKANPSSMAAALRLAKQLAGRGTT